VKDNLYMITGSDPTDRNAFSGGNTGVFVTNSRVVVVDTKLAGWGHVLLEKIKTVTDKPVTTIINTLRQQPMFPASVEIVAHENTKANMEKMDAFKGDNAKFPAEEDLQGQAVARHRQGSRRSLLLRAAGTRTATPGSSIRRCRVMQTGDMFAVEGRAGPRSQQRRRPRIRRHCRQGARHRQGRRHAHRRSQPVAKSCRAEFGIWNE
jgi:hypothetical protein